MNREEIRKEVTVIIAAHKKYRMPEDPMYLPLHVGAEGKKDENGDPLDLGYAKDNTGDNISELNPSFCELTGLYWAWKNLDSRYTGLVHYRRHFGKKVKDDPFKGILKFEDIAADLGRTRVFVPRKRKYYIESLYSHYGHTHYAEHLDITRQIICEKYPDYTESYDRVVRHTYGFMFNMMIMERELLDDYCSWLFDILFELKDRVGEDDLSAFQARFYGRVSEIIFNVWLDRQISSGRISDKEIKELGLIYMEKINWINKGGAFIKAKLFHKRYENSF